MGIGSNLSDKKIRIVTYPDTDEIWYTSALNDVIWPTITTDFGQNIVYNIYDSGTGHGIIKFDGEITAIPEKAFINQNAMTSVSLPKSVIQINDYAFYGCTSLKKVHLPYKLTTIKEGAFYWCVDLENITIPATVSTIGNKCFWEDIQLSNVECQSSPSFGDFAFYGCDELTSLTIKGESKEVPKYTDAPDSTYYINGGIYAGVTNNTTSNLTCQYLALIGEGEADGVAMEQYNDDGSYSDWLYRTDPFNIGEIYWLYKYTDDGLVSEWNKSAKNTATSFDFTFKTTNFVDEIGKYRIHVPNVFDKPVLVKTILSGLSELPDYECFWYDPNSYTVPADVVMPASLVSLETTTNTFSGSLLKSAK